MSQTQTPQEIMADYRAELRRVNGDQYADEAEIYYGRGWYYLNLPRKLPNGGYGRWGPASAYRRKQVLEFTANLRKHPSKQRPIRAVWVNDPFSSGVTPDQEAERELERLQLDLGLAIDLIRAVRGMEDVGDERIDLLVFDYGGARQEWAAYPQMHAARAWAGDHPGSLVLLYTAYTARFYEEELSQETDLANILSRCGSLLERMALGGMEADDAALDTVRAWFVGDQFAPYVPPESEAHAGLVNPGLRRSRDRSNGS